MRYRLITFSAFALLASISCSDDEPAGDSDSNSPGMNPVVMAGSTGGTGTGVSRTIDCDGDKLLVRSSQYHCFDPRTVNDPPPAPSNDGGAGGGGGAGGAAVVPEQPVIPPLPPFKGECPASADVTGACFEAICASAPAAGTQDDAAAPCCYYGDFVNCSPQ